MQNLAKTITSLAARSREASRLLAQADDKAVNRALLSMAQLLTTKRSTLDKANQKDLAMGKAKGLSGAMLDRLTLSDKTITSMVEGLKTLTKLGSPVGQTYDRRTRPNGLLIYKRRVPIGVVGIIYESRPNVTVDAAAICLKSRNAVILRGGSEAFFSNKALAELFSQALLEAKLPANAVTLVPTTEREAISVLLGCTESVDLIIPRGGEGLIERVVKESQIPVIKHYKGVCHIFVSRKADMTLALPVIINAKTQRPGVCNALETLLLDGGLSEARRRLIVEGLLKSGVKLFGDPATRALSSEISRATTADWEAEYLDMRLALRTVSGIDQAIEHINRYGSHHTDAILSSSKQEIAHFAANVDSASVMINTSTRFADGGEYGMGCEIGISTDKLHARGPMGIEDLTTYKWIVEGSGQVRT